MKLCFNLVEPWDLSLWAGSTEGYYCHWTTTFNNLYLPQSSASDDILVLASSDLTKVEQLFVAVKLQVFRMHVLYFKKYKM